LFSLLKSKRAITLVGVMALVESLSSCSGYITRSSSACKGRRQ
jgi:hypothetical protein